MSEEIEGKETIDVLEGSKVLSEAIHSLNSLKVQRLLIRRELESCEKSLSEAVVIYDKINAVIERELHRDL